MSSTVSSNLRSPRERRAADDEDADRLASGISPPLAQLRSLLTPHTAWRRAYMRQRGMECSSGGADDANRSAGNGRHTTSVASGRLKRRFATPADEPASRRIIVAGEPTVHEEIVSGLPSRVSRCSSCSGAVVAGVLWVRDRVDRRGGVLFAVDERPAPLGPMTIAGRTHDRAR
jgi:hypothetical protein